MAQLLYNPPHGAWTFKRQAGADAAYIDSGLHGVLKPTKNGFHRILPIVLERQDWRDELERDCPSGVSIIKNQVG